MKKVLTIFILPNEIQQYEYLINSIQKDIDKFGLKDFYIDCTLSVSNQMVNWKESTISKEEIVNTFNSINKNKVGTFTVDETEEIMGCVSKRRETYLKYQNDSIVNIWLDPDWIFPEGTFYIFDNAINELVKQQEYFILTPQMIKMWDDSWNPITHPNFIDKPTNYRVLPEYDPHKDKGIYGEVSLVELPKFLFKFGGGWGTVISTKLLNKIGIPQSFGHYGEEDSFVMTASSMLVKGGLDVKQYVLNNVVSALDYSPKLKDIVQYDRRKEFRKIAQQNFNNELKRIIE